MMLAVFAAVSVILYVSHTYQFLWASDLIVIKPLYWYFVTLVTGAGLIVTHRACWSPSRSVIFLLIWSVVFFAIISVSYFVSSQSPVALQTTINYSEATLIMLVMVMVLQVKIAYQWASIALVGTLVFGVAVNIIDFLSLAGMTFSTVDGRAAGFYENPNIAGKILVVGMVLALPVLKSSLRFLFCIAVGLGVVLTFSRSSMLMWALAVITLSWFEFFVLRRLQSVLTMFLVLFGLTLTLAAGQWLGALEKVGLGAQLNDNTQARIGGSFTAQDDLSSRERTLVAEKGMRLFLRAPIFGHGIGATREWSTRASTHNMYLLLGAEQGIVGIFLFLALLWVVWRSGSREAKIVAGLYAASGMFTHNNFDQPAIQILIAMAVANAGREFRMGQSHV